MNEENFSTEKFGNETENLKKFLAFFVCFDIFLEFTFSQFDFSST